MGKSQLISASELQELLGDEELRVIDCRFDLGKPEAGRAAYLETHVPGAVYAHLDDDLAGPVTPDSGRHPLPDADVLAKTLGKMGVALNTSVVVYDSGNGAMAARAWWLLRWLGHEDVRLLNGGFGAWAGADAPTSSGEEQPAPKEFVANPRDELIITTDELIKAGKGIKEMNLMDARDAARFRGEAEPIDSIAGHIPGARNLPLTESLGAGGEFLEKADLEALWDGILGPDRDRSWAVMCGSGVTACHLALSGIEAGRVEPRVYVGSWSEWIRDPQRGIGSGDA